MQVEQLLVPATCELLRANGGHVEQLPKAEPGEAIVATLGFAGADISGAVVLVGLEPTVRTLVASIFETQPASEALLCDMLGELSNLIVGKYRATLLKVGVEILPATPISLRASDVDMKWAGGSSPWHAFTTDGGPFWIRLDLRFRDHFDLSSPSQEPITSNELELVFF